MIANFFSFGHLSSQTIAHWDFNEGSGSVLNDVSSNDHHGTINNADWGSGYLCFNGSNSEVNVPYDPAFSGLSQLTVQTRFKVTSLPAPGDYGRIVAVYDHFNGFNSSTEQAFNLAIYQYPNNTTYLGFTARMDASAAYNGQAAIYVYDSFPLNVWLDVTGIFDNGSIYLYVNGELLSEENPNPGASLNTASTPLTIGYSIGTNNDNDPLNTHFEGCIDDIQIFNGIILPNPTSIIEKQNESQNIVLSQNYPNPFKTSTTIDYEILYSGYIGIKIFNLIGKEVTTVIQKYHSVGKYSVLWDGNDLNGISQPNGIYFYALIEDNNIIAAKSMIKF